MQLPSGVRKGNTDDAGQGLAVGCWVYGNGSARFPSLNLPYGMRNHPLFPNSGMSPEPGSPPCHAPWLLYCAAAAMKACGELELRK